MIIHDDLEERLIHQPRAAVRALVATTCPMIPTCLVDEIISWLVISRQTKAIPDLPAEIIESLWMSSHSKFSTSVSMTILDYLASPEPLDCPACPACLECPSLECPQCLKGRLPSLLPLERTLPSLSILIFADMHTSRLGASRWAPLDILGVSCWAALDIFADPLSLPQTDATATSETAPVSSGTRWEQYLRFVRFSYIEIF